MLEHPPIQFSKEVIGAERFQLLQSMIAASIHAWQEGIKPLMSLVRGATIGVASHKKGTDFFTEADLASERIIISSLVTEYGDGAFRIFGEESGAYTGNLDAKITIRIDPIDGTESFKFGKPTWSIMIGAYVGRGALEHQVASTVYWPEYYDEIMFSLDEVGVFKADLKTGAVVEFSHVDDQSALNELIVSFWKHSNIAERGMIDEIIKALESTGARVRTITPAEVKEAVETRGKRAMVLDGDFTEVDFISYSILTRLGYIVCDWDGTRCSVDDAALSNKKLVFTPPGRAGEQILDVVRALA